MWKMRGPKGPRFEFQKPELEASLNSASQDSMQRGELNGRRERPAWLLLELLAPLLLELPFGEVGQELEAGNQKGRVEIHEMAGERSPVESISQFTSS